MYRGTILEFVPGDHLLLLLPSGDTRRFAASEIATTETTPAPTVAAPTAPAAPTAAGPASATARYATPNATGAPVRLRVSGNAPGLTLMIRSGFAYGQVGTQGAYVVHFDRLCSAPCDLELAPGNHTFAVEDERGRTRAVRRPVMINGSGTLDVSIQNRRKQRAIRWVVSLASMAVGIPLLLRGLNGSCSDYDYYDEPCRNWGLVATGSTLLGLGYGMMFGAIFTRDRGQVVFRPD